MRISEQAKTDFMRTVEGGLAWYAQRVRWVIGQWPGWRVHHWTASGGVVAANEHDQVTVTITASVPTAEIVVSWNTHGDGWQPDRRLWHSRQAAEPLEDWLRRRATELGEEEPWVAAV